MTRKTKRRQVRDAIWSAKALRNAGLRDSPWQADLAGANLHGADLSRMSLSSVNLDRADLAGANLMDADLQGASLRGADLRGAFLRGALLKGADFTGADLAGAHAYDEVVVDRMYVVDHGGIYDRGMEPAHGVTDEPAEPNDPTPSPLVQRVEDARRARLEKALDQLVEELSAKNSWPCEVPARGGSELLELVKGHFDVAILSHCRLWRIQPKGGAPK